MLGLGREVERDQLGVGAAVGGDQQVARPGEAIDADDAGQLPLGLLDPEVPGADDHVDLADGRGPVGEGRDGVRPAHPVDAVGAGQAGGGAQDEIVGGRRDDDLVDARGPRGHDAHDHGRGVRRPPPGT